MNPGKLIAAFDIPGSSNVNNGAGGQITNPALGPNLQGLSQIGGGIEFFKPLIPKIITLAFILGALIFFFMLIVGGIQWIASGGDKQALESARGRITNALIGIVILFATFAIIQVIQGFFHVNILNISLPTLTGS